MNKELGKAPLLISDMASSNFLDNKLLNRFIQAIPVAIYTTDSEGYVTMYNQAAVQLWGREPELGKDLWCGSWEIYRTDGSALPFDECPMARTLKEERAVTDEEIVVARPDGSRRNVQPYSQPIFNDSGELIGAVNMLIDVTETRHFERQSEARYRTLYNSLERLVDEKTQDLKKKSEEMKQSEQRYHKMIEQVEDYAIIFLDKDGIVQNWNKGAEKIKGYKEKEIVGRSFSEFYRPADREEGLPTKLLNKARQTGKAIHEGWRLRKDGTQFWGSIVLTALHDSDNNIIGFSKVTRDLTERKVAEDQAREYSNELEFQNRQLEQFAYAASHDLKEPLRKIHFYNCSIAENNANHLDAKSREYLERSINATKRMSELIEDLLTYSRATSSVQSYEPINLNDLVDQIMLLHKEDFEQKKIIMRVKPLPIVHGVRFQFKQLMDNLINNSLKYKHPSRPLMINISDEGIVKGHQIKDTDAEHERNYYHISISDNGIGFEDQYAEKIFEIFQRLNNPSVVKGSGIGLAICKKIVQNHKGIIKAHGKVDEGARFDIFIPV